MERESRRVVVMSSAIKIREKEEFVEFSLCGMVAEDELFIINVQLGSQQESINAYVNESLDRWISFQGEGAQMKFRV